MSTTGAKRGDEVKEVETKVTAITMMATTGGTEAENIGRRGAKSLHHRGIIIGRRGIGSGPKRRRRGAGLTEVHHPATIAAVMAVMIAIVAAAAARIRPHRDGIPNVAKNHHIENHPKSHPNLLTITNPLTIQFNSMKN